MVVCTRKGRQNVVHLRRWIVSLRGQRSLGPRGGELLVFTSISIQHFTAELFHLLRYLYRAADRSIYLISRGGGV